MSTVVPCSGLWEVDSGNTLAAAGAITISGVGDDEKLNLVANITASGDIVISAGDYLNNGHGDYTKAVTASNVYVITGIDGSRYRQNDGSYIVTPGVGCSGVLYAFTE